MGGTIMVATDGTPAALGALRFARALSQKEPRDVHVLGVVEPIPVFDSGFMVALPEMELYESRRESLKSEIASQLGRLSESAQLWPLSVQAGIPGTRIVQHAEKVRADLILMGLGRHGPMDRVFGTETVLQVLRISHIPVLAVPEVFDGLPETAVLAVDFSLFSQRATQVAIGLLDSPWTVHLVHVLSGMEFLPNLAEGWRVDYEGEALGRLEDFARDLEPAQGSQSQFHVLEGEPSHELLAFSERERADLLVAGSHGHSFVGRLLMGSVSTRLIRASKVPVLVVPPVERSEELPPDGQIGDETRGWVQELNDFTKLNAGRRTTLEMHDPETGKQECGCGFPLWGVDYDPRRDRIDIMLGRSGTVEGHLTHSLTAPQEIQISAGKDGRVDALRIELKRGRAVLKIHRD